MVNTRKENYAAKSSEEVHDALVSKSSMYGVRMRGVISKVHRRGDYRLLLEKF